MLGEGSQFICKALEPSGNKSLLLKRNLVSALHGVLLAPSGRKTGTAIVN